MEQVHRVLDQEQAADLVSVRQVRRRHPDIMVPSRVLESVAVDCPGVEVAAVPGVEAGAGTGGP